MKKIVLVISFVTMLFLLSCSRKSHPSKTSTETTIKSADTSSITKPVVRRKPKAPLPQVIVVNDSAAHKNVDGKLYYDVMGHRYWRSKKDGKYYLFNKSMYNNPDFNKPSSN